MTITRLRFAAPCALGVAAALLFAVGCERSNTEQIQDGASDIGSGISGAVEDAADAAADGLRRADEAVGDAVGD